MASNKRIGAATGSSIANLPSVPAKAVDVRREGVGVRGLLPVAIEKSLNENLTGVASMASEAEGGVRTSTGTAVYSSTSSGATTDDYHASGSSGSALGNAVVWSNGTGGVPNGPGLDQPIFFDPTDMVAGAVAGFIAGGPAGALGAGIVAGLARGGIRAAARNVPDVALGLSQHPLHAADGLLRLFADHVGAVDYWRWPDVGLSSPGKFVDEFAEATSRTGQIHFNLDGIDDVQGALRLGANGPVSGSVANWELLQIQSSPDLLNKTLPYRGGMVVDPP